LKALFVLFFLVPFSHAETGTLPSPEEGEKCTLICVEKVFMAPTVESLDSLEDFTSYQKAWMKKKFLKHYPNGINPNAKQNAAELSKDGE
jgi:hypothetical protein